MKFWELLPLSLLAVAITACDPDPVEPPQPAAASGLFVINEGNYGYSNASLTFYNTESDTAASNVFYRANGMKLGDVAQSMTMHRGSGWVVVNGSGAIYHINADDFREIGRLENMSSPRYIHFISDTKAYVTQLYENRIYIVDPTKHSVTGYIDIDKPADFAGSGATEQMVQIGDYVYVNCWSYDKRVLKIDSRTDKVVDQTAVGIQPCALVADKNDCLWVITDGGWEGNPLGSEAPTLVCLDSRDLKVLKSFSFPLGSYPSKLVTDPAGSRLYWLDGGVWEMSIDADALPSSALISDGRFYYGLTVSPTTGDIYASDALDYQQPGIVYRFSSAGSQIGSFSAGVIPGKFCWK